MTKARDLADIETGAWTSFTPSMFGATTNPTIGNTTFNCAYVQVGKIVFARYLVTLGSTFVNGSGTYTFGLPPVTASSNSAVSGAAQIRDASASAQYRATMVAPAATDRTGVLMFTDGGAQGTAFGSTSFTAPAVSDTITLSFFYEAA